MAFEITASCRIKALDGRIIQNISAPAPLDTRPQIVDVRSSAAFEYRNEFVFRSIEAALTGIGLVPDQQVFPFRIERKRGGEELVEVTPVDEDVVDGAITAAAHGTADKLMEQSSKCRQRHFAGTHNNFCTTAAHCPIIDA